jgi:His/Glu/Gln/Arg/opine family amino acid ABC transporter permease subunit
MDASVIIDNAGLFARGTLNTLIVAGSTIVLSLACAFPLAVLRESSWRWIAVPIAVYSWMARATPALAVLFVTYYGLPTLGLFLDPLSAAVLGLTLVSTGYNLEFIRAGLRAVPVGQIDAARALGLPRLAMLRKVILPQAMIVSVPPLVSNLTLMLKGSALASLVAVSELTGEAMALIAYTYRSIEILSCVAVIYLALAGVLVAAQHRLEARLMAHLLPQPDDGASGQKMKPAAATRHSDAAR